MSHARMLTLAISTLLFCTHIHASSPESYSESQDDIKMTRLQNTAKAGSYITSNNQFPSNVIPDVPDTKSLTYRVTMRRGSGINSVYLPDSARDGDIIRIEAKFPTATGECKVLNIRGALYGFEGGVHIYSSEGSGFANYAMLKYSGVDKKWKVERLGEPHQNQYRESSSSEYSNIPTIANYTKYTIKENSAHQTFTLSNGHHQDQATVIISEKDGVFLDKKYILHADKNIAFRKGDVILAKWLPELDRWVLTSLNKSRFLPEVIRKIQFSELSINAGISDLPFYNNGRMQKPVDIYYRAQLVDDGQDVKLSPEEERYYLNISIVGQPSTTLTSLYNKFIVEQQHNPRYTSIGAARRGAVKKSEKTRFYIRYMGRDSNDIIANLNLCVWSSNSSDGSFDSNEVDCSPTSSTGSVRPISVQSGAYQIGDTLAMNRAYENKWLCNSWDSCNSLFRTRDNESNDIAQALANAWVFSSTRGHKFRPLDVSHSSSLAVGCKDSKSGGVPPDGICYSGGYGDFYGTRMTFGHTNLEPIKYTIKDKFHNSFYNGYQEYRFNLSDINVNGKFAIISVMGDFSNGFYQLVRFTDAGEWAGQTFGNNLRFKRRIEDEFGNRFDFQGTLDEIPGTTFAGDQQRFLGMLRTNELVVTNIYN